jgi:hypothetical protein
MPTITQTTLTDLEADLANVIAAIEPTHSDEQTAGWVRGEDRELPESSMVPRLFWFEWKDAGVVAGGATGNLDVETSIVMFVVVDYRAFREEDRAQIVESDHWDLADRFADVWEGNGVGSVDGLTFTESDRWEVRDAGRVAHKFNIQYQRARRVA